MPERSSPLTAAEAAVLLLAPDVEVEPHGEPLGGEAPQDLGDAQVHGDGHQVGPAVAVEVLEAARKVDLVPASPLQAASR